MASVVPHRFKIQGLEAIREHRYLWRMNPDENGGKMVTEVSVNLAGRCPGALKIVQQGFTTLMGGILRGARYRTGDKLFDSLYAVYARPESLAERLFAPPMRSAVIASSRRIGPYVDSLIDLSRDRLLIQVSENLDHAPGVQNLEATARDFVGHILDLAAPQGIAWGETGLGESAHCPVCNAGLSAPLVYCLACRTPHHGDCWSYLGGCSMFGCGSRRAGAAPAGS